MENKKQPFFSVIVPIYKVEKYITDCIESILNQTFDNFELILVDDGSPDNCPKICDKYQKKDKRVMVIHKKNGGLVSARNAGINASKGKYICYVDGDDTIHKDLLKTIYEDAILLNNPDIIIFGIVKNFENYDEEIICDLEEGIYNKKELIENIYPYMMYDSRKPFCKGLIFPAACNKIYKKELLLKHYCRDERIRMGEDNAFVYECLWNSDKIYVCNKIFYFYNQLNPSAMNQSYDPNRFRNNSYLFEYMDSRLGNKDKIINEQLNAFKAYWITMAVFHEIKSGHKVSEAARNIKKGIKEYKPLDKITFKGLPKSAIIFLMLLKLKFYRLTAFLVKIIQIRRNKKIK